MLILFVSVIGMDQFRFEGDRPTPGELSVFLRRLQVFQDSAGQDLHYNPSGFVSAFSVSSLCDGKSLENTVI